MQDKPSIDSSRQLDLGSCSILSENGDPTEERYLVSFPQRLLPFRQRRGHCPNCLLDSATPKSSIRGQIQPATRIQATSIQRLHLLFLRPIKQCSDHGTLASPAESPTPSLKRRLIVSTIQYFFFFVLHLNLMSSPSNLTPSLTSCRPLPPLLLSSLQQT